MGKLPREKWQGNLQESYDKSVHALDAPAAVEAGPHAELHRSRLTLNSRVGEEGEVVDSCLPLQSLNHRQMKFVKLDVGGVNYTTTRGTLTREPGSMLARMFEGELPPCEQDKDGRLVFTRASRRREPLPDKRMTI